MNDEDEGGRMGLWIGVGVGVFVALATAFMLLGDDGGAGQGQNTKGAGDAKAAATAAAASAMASKAAAGAAAAGATVAAAAASAASTAASALDAVLDLPLTGELAGKVYFEVGKATLDAEANATIDKAAKEITASTKPNRIMLSGFHDLSGDPAKNAELAKDRAKAVRDAMAAKGVPADRVVLRKPAETGSGGSPAEARRVEIRLID